MKTVVLASDSSTKSTSTTTAASTSTTTTNGSNIESDTRDNYYYPGCRKDAKCGCEICLASLNATLDLMPQSIQRSSLSKLSASRPISRSPVSFNPSSFSTPRSRIRRVPFSPPLKSTARMSFHVKTKRNKRKSRFGFILMRLAFGMGLALALEYAMSWIVSGLLRPKLSMDVVRHVGEKSWFLQDLNERQKFIRKELESLVDEEVSDCRPTDTKWKINQDGLLLNSYCILYKSATEEVSIWGWPLQTAGLLTAEFSSRSYNILNGRIAEWSNGEFNHMIRTANSSWTQGKWSSSVVHLSPSTWILEYQASPVVENSRLLSALLEFLKFRFTKGIKQMKQELWLLSAFGRQYNDFTVNSFIVPT